MDNQLSAALILNHFVTRLTTLAIVFCWTTTQQKMAQAFSASENLKPKLDVDASETGLRFAGNATKSNHFKLLKRDGEFLLIGAQDAVYNISALDFSTQTHILWSPSDDDVQNCFMNGKSEDECHNYIRVLAKDPVDQSLVVCGTNAFRPACRVYKPGSDGSYDSFEKFDGVGLVPYDPTHNSTAEYIPETKELFAGTVALFDGTDPLVLRRKINSADFGIRTERYDTKILNEPNFLKSFADQKHVYFWFREAGIEYTNCGRTVVSRVARVCRNDRGGGARGNNDSWTSFLKARLNCSISGEYPFYFDQLEATSDVVSGDYGSLGSANLVYAVFNTPFETVRMSAVCAFSLEQIKTTFATSAFKSQSSTASYCLPPQKSDDPKTRPGNCDSDIRELSADVANFVRKNPLLEEAVSNFFHAPFMVHTGKKARFTQIAVDSQVAAIDGRRYDVLFLGTEDGRILKAVNIFNKDLITVAYVASINVFSKPQLVKNLLVYKSNDTASPEVIKKLIVVIDDEIRALPLHFCYLAKTCAQCIQLRDPHCAWSLSQMSCIGKDNGEWTSENYLQDIATANAAQCGPDNDVQGTQEPKKQTPSSTLKDVSSFDLHSSFNNDIDSGSSCKCSEDANGLPDGNATNSGQGRRLSDELASNSVKEENSRVFQNLPRSGKIYETKLGGAVYSGEALAVAIVVSIVVASLTGFVLGYKFSSNEKLKLKLLSWSVAANCKGAQLEKSLSAKKSSKLSNHIDAYQPMPKFNGAGHILEPVSLVLSLDEPKLDKNSLNLSNNNFSTLPKDYKVKKVYL